LRRRPHCSIAEARGTARCRIASSHPGADAGPGRIEGTAQGNQAIGVFSKICLKNEVDDLVKQLGDHYQGKTKPTIAELRQSYDLLMMKVLSLLQDGDHKLASAVVSSREAIWALLADEKSFAALQS
jgi:hypothetical protein